MTKHRARLYLYRQTGEVVAVPLGDEVARAGLVGPRLSALTAFSVGLAPAEIRLDSYKDRPKVFFAPVGLVPAER